MSRPSKPRTRSTAFRLPLDVLALLDQLARRRGLNRTARLIMMIVDTARQEGLIGPEDTAGPSSDRS